MLTDTEIEFIRLNYQILGGTDCAKALNRSRHAICVNAKTMGLSLTHEHRSAIMQRKLDKLPEQRNVNPLPFTIAEKMEEVNSYLLGFIWADGHISFCGTGQQIIANFVSDDDADIIPLFLQTGKWAIRTQQPKNCRQATYISTNNPPMAKFLKNMGYGSKSTTSAEKILDFMRPSLRRYWWLGCFDGDGCFSTGEKHREISISSSHEQDWTHFERLAVKLGIEYHLERRIAKRGKSSCVRIVKKQSCSKLVHYLYPNGYEFGLQRKFEKAQQILQWSNSYIKPGPKGPWKHCKLDS